MTADANIWRPPATTTAVRVTGRGAAEVVSKSAEGRGEAAWNDKPAQYRRQNNGLARHVDPSLNWRKRIVHNPYVWITLICTVFFAMLLYPVYWMVGTGLIGEVAQVTKQSVGTETVLVWGQINEALLKVIPYAAATLCFYLIVLVLADRLRPTTWTMKWFALCWGGCAAVLLSLIVNTWAGALMNIQGPVDASQGLRAAVFSAPFVEEAAKGTILFFLAIVMRRRIVSVHQSLTLAALSGLGFAFTENIVYYLRTYMYAVTISGTDADQELVNLFLMRGVFTSFGHMLFTSMTALGLIVALSNRSKLVRILAPVAGYLTAALGHMMFNGISSIGLSPAIIIIGGWIVVIGLAVYSAFRFVHQKRNIRARLYEIVRLGWLEPSDPYEMSRIRGRCKMAICSFLRGPRVFRATLRLQRDLTELAYVRDAEMRGIIDAMAIERERELVMEIAKIRVWAIDHSKGTPFIPPEWGEAWRRLIDRITDYRAQRRSRRNSAPLNWTPPNGAPAAAGPQSWAPPVR